METPPAPPTPPSGQPLKAGAKTSEGGLVATVAAAGLSMAIAAEGRTQLAYFGLLVVLACVWTASRSYVKRGQGGGA